MHASIGQIAMTLNRKGPQMKDQKYLDQLAAAERRARSRAAPQPSHGKTTSLAPPKIELDPSHRARSVDEIVAKIERGDAAEREATRARSRVRKAIDGVERQSGNGDEISGTGFTILKRADTPITRLLTGGKIGPEELRAAEDITTAFHAQAGALFLKPQSLDRRDPSHGSSEPTRIIDAVTRYARWAGMWSVRASRGDPTLEIVVSAVIDERGFREIEADLGLRNGRAGAAAAAGLRDYAARAGWAQGEAARAWLVGEGSVFRLRRVRPVETLSGMARRWDREASDRVA